MLTEALSIALIARQYGRQISLEKVEKAARSENFASEKKFVSYFSDQGVRVTKKKITADGVVARPYLFPCVTTLDQLGGVVLTSYSVERESLSYVDPTNPSSGSKQLAMGQLREQWGDGVWLASLTAERASLARPFDWSWFTPELMRYRWVILFVFFLSLLLHALSFTPILYLQISLDKVVGYGASATLNVLTVGVIALLIMNSLMTVGRDYAIRFIGQAIEARLLTDAFDKFLKLPAGTIYGSSSISPEKRITGGSSLRKFVTERLIANILDLSALLIFVPILFAYSAKLGALVMAFVLLQALISYGFRRIDGERSQLVASAENSALSTLRETVAGIDIVKALSLEEKQRKSWRHAASRLIRQREDKDWIQSVATQASNLIQQVMTVAVLFFGINLVFGGDLMAGSLIAVNMVAGRIIGPVKQAVGLLSELEKARQIKDEVSFIWNENPERKGFGKEIRVRGAIEFKNVSTRRDENSPGLADVCVAIRPGERVAIIGAPDCGSELVMSCLVGNVRPTAGSIEIDKNALTQLSLEHYRNQVAFLGVNPRFFDGTIESNLRRANPNISDSEIEDALKISGLEEVIDALPEGLNTLVNASASSLTAPQRIKLNLARGLAMDAAIILISRGFDGLDREAQLDFVQSHRENFGNKTLLLATDHVSLAVRFDKILVMDQGQVVSQGSHDWLLKNCEVYTGLVQVERRLARELWAESQ